MCIVELPNLYPSSGNLIYKKKWTEKVEWEDVKGDLKDSELCQKLWSSHKIKGECIWDFKD